MKSIPLYMVSLGIVGVVIGLLMTTEDTTSLWWSTFLIEKGILALIVGLATTAVVGAIEGKRD